MTPPEALDGSLGRHYKSLGELVYQRLRNEILWGNMQPGSILSLRRLSEQFGVSPMPVRDAVRRLATEGLVEVSPRSSTRVARVSPEGVKEVFEFAAASKHSQPAWLSHTSPPQTSAI